MICVHCQYEQDAGNFCTVCGNPFYDSIIPEELPTQSMVAATKNIEVHDAPSESRVARVSKERQKTRYTTYITQVLQYPDKGFAADERYFSYGLFTIGFYVLAFALSFYFLANKLYTLMLGGLSSLFTENGSQQSLPFIDFTSSIFFFVLLFVIAAIACMYFGTRFMGEGISFKLLIAQYGSIILPFTILNLLAIIFGLFGASGLTIFTTGLSLFFIIYVIPALFIYNRGVKSSRTLNVLYWSVGTTAFSMLISYIIVHYFVIDFLRQIQDVSRML